MMKVNELIEKMNEDGFELDKVIEVNAYIPIQVKRAIAQEIVYESTFEDEGVLKIDSFERYMSFVRHMIREHTNLDYTDEDYDTLCSTVYEDCSLLDAIMSLFGADAKECSRILDMVTGDKMQDATLESVIAKALYNLEIKMGSVLKMITDKTAEAMPENIDMDKLSEFLNNYVK